jgi:hypothetical protein
MRRMDLSEDDDSAAATQARGCDRLFRADCRPAALCVTYCLARQYGDPQGRRHGKAAASVGQAGTVSVLPPTYSTALNRIEILWKHAKYFWRRFAAVNGADLLDEIQSLMKCFGSEFALNFA